jgi:hypothetical protein
MREQAEGCVIAIVLFFLISSAGVSSGQEHDWAKDADNDAAALVSQDLQSGSTRSPMGLVLAMGSFAQHHGDYTRDETAHYATAFIPFYMQQLRLQGESLAGPIPEQQPGTNRLSSSTEDEMKKQLKVASFDVTTAEPTALMKHADQWFWALKYRINSTSESGSRNSSDVYIYFTDGKLFRVWEDPKSVKGASSDSSSPREASQNTESEAGKQQRILNSLKIEHLSGHTDHGYLMVRGDVTNTGTIPVKFVQIEVEYLDAQGNVIDQNSTYVDDAAFILPGSTGTFSTMKSNQGGNIVSYKARIVPSFRTSE